jgi:hypothetical protein
MKGETMKRHYVVIGMAIIIATFTLSFWTLTAAQGQSDSQPGNAAAAQRAVDSPSSDSNPAGAPEIRIPEQYQPRPATGGDAASTALVAPIYFTPQDENTSTTVLFLYNTGATTATVDIATYGLDGSPYLSTSVAVPPDGLVRICADEVDTISASWQDVVWINFTTSSTYGSMTLPDGVKAEGYVVWNGGVTYDPLQIVPALSLRFSIDRPSVFLPTVRRH